MQLLGTRLAVWLSKLTQGDSAGLKKQFIVLELSGYDYLLAGSCARACSPGASGSLARRCDGLHRGELEQVAIEQQCKGHRQILECRRKEGLKE